MLPTAKRHGGYRDAAVRSLATPERLEALFTPRSIALVGASDRSGWSKLLIDSLETVGFDGTWTPVHPKHDTAFGRATVPSLRQLSTPVDLAYILAPQHAVETVLEDAAAAGIRNVVVLAAGYEDDGERGRKRQQRLVDMAIAHDITLLGPNGVGYVNAPAKVAPYGLEIINPLKCGAVSAVLQSGGLASAVLDVHRARSIGLSLLVSMGNEAIVRTVDVVEYLIEDASTKVISLFLEGIRDADRFTALAARALEVGKPIVALKVGSTPEGQRSAAAHTGAVAGDDAVVDAAFRQFGVIRVSSIEEMVVTAGLLAEGPPLTGRRMGVISLSGGLNDIIADRASEEGIQLPAFTARTTARLREGAVPEYGSALNPVDATAFGLAEDSTSDETSRTAALSAVSEDPEIDFILCMGVAVPEIKPELRSDLVESRTAYLAEVVAQSPIPVVAMSETFCSLGPYQRELLERYHVHLVGGMEFGISALGHALRWQERRRRGPVPLTQRPCSIAGTALESGTVDGPWPESEGRRLLHAGGVPLVPARLASCADEAVAAAEEFGYPVVLKAQARGLVHKSNVGGVTLDLRSPAAVRNAFADIDGRIRRAMPDGSLEGVLVSPMRRGGVELLAGVKHDPVFGPALAVGLGGIWVELLHDVALRVLPVSRSDVIEMLGELRSAPLLNGLRGTEPVNLQRAAAVIHKLSDVALSLGPRLTSLEVNPFWCRGDQIEALDVLVVTGEATQANPNSGGEA